MHEATEAHMRIAIVGSGYVGLVAGACFADSGNQVVCADIDAGKVARLTRGELPIYEPGLDELVTRGTRAGTLRFTSDLQSAVATAEVVIIAVGTPQGETGAADISAVGAAADAIGAA